MLNTDFHCVKSVHIRSYSFRMRENTEQNNFVYGHFLPNFFAKYFHNYNTSTDDPRSAIFPFCLKMEIITAAFKKRIKGLDETIDL